MMIASLSALRMMLYSAPCLDQLILDGTLTLENRTCFTVGHGVLELGVINCHADLDLIPQIYTGEHSTQGPARRPLTMERHIVGGLRSFYLERCRERQNR